VPWLVHSAWAAVSPPNKLVQYFAHELLPPPPPLAAQAIPGMEAIAPPTRAAPIIRSALRLETLPLASLIANSSKERSLVSGDIASPFPKGRD
jgi:hypothetical protein